MKVLQIDDDGSEMEVIRHMETMISSENIEEIFEAYDRAIHVLYNMIRERFTSFAEARMYKLREEAVSNRIEAQGGIG